MNSNEKPTEKRTEEGTNEGKRDTKKETSRRRNKKADIEIPDDGVPYDRGWAWMIVLAGFTNFVMTAGYNRSTFIFFVNFLEEFRAPVTETALLFGVKAGINSIVGLFIMNAVVGRFGVRKTVFAGAICLSLSAILGSFATNITTLILTQAVFHGLGMSMLNMPTTVLLGFYFRRRRSLANSITKCGVGVGAVASPPLVTYFLSQYGLRGSLLLMGGICLNAVVGAALLRPTSFYKKRKQLRSKESNQKLLSEDGDVGQEEEDVGIKLTTISEVREDNDDTGIQTDKTKVALEANGLLNEQYPAGRDRDDKMFPNGTSASHVIVIQAPVTPVDVQRIDDKKTCLPPPATTIGLPVLSSSTPELFSSAKDSNLRPRTFSVSEAGHPDKESSSGNLDNVLDALNQSQVIKYLSRPDLETDSPCVAPPNGQPQQTERKEPKRSCLRATWQVLKRIFGVLDFTLFQSPMFRLLVVFYICSPMAMAVSTYMPAMAKERGLDENQRATILSIIGALDFCCRLACGFIADLGVIKVSTMIAIAFTILGVVCQLTRLLTSFSLMIGLAAAQGLLGGVAACLMPILIMEDIGLEHTAKALGFNKLFSGAAMAAIHPLLGFIRDTTGSYDAVYNVIGALTLSSAGVIMCLRFLPHRLSPKEKTDDINESVQPEETLPLTS